MKNRLQLLETPICMLQFTFYIIRHVSNFKLRNKYTFWKFHGNTIFFLKVLYIESSIPLDEKNN